MQKKKANYSLLSRTLIQLFEYALNPSLGKKLVQKIMVLRIRPQNPPDFQ